MKRICSIITLLLYSILVFPMIKIGHRGANGYELENSIASFKKARELDVDMIELDVQCCASGELIVMHDKKIDRTTTGSGYLSDLTLTDLQQYQLNNGEPIPTLRNVFDFIDKKIAIDIEIKGQECAQKVIDLIGEYVSRGWQYKHFLVTSFDHHQLQHIQQHAPEIPLGVLIVGMPLDYATCATELNATTIVACKDFINQVFVDDAHKRGLKIFVFTANEPDEITCLKKLGVDGIISDYPDRL